MTKKPKSNEVIRYSLANGDFLEYRYSPDFSICNLVNYLVEDYTRSHRLKGVDPWSSSPSYRSMPNKVYLRSDIYNKLLSQGVMFDVTPNSETPQITVQTAIGRLLVMNRSGLPFPVFYGSDDELENAEFTDALEKNLEQ